MASMMSIGSLGFRGTGSWPALSHTLSPGPVIKSIISAENGNKSAAFGDFWKDPGGRQRLRV